MTDKPKATTAVVGGALGAAALAAIILFDQNSANRNGVVKETQPVLRPAESWDAAVERAKKKKGEVQDKPAVASSVEAPPRARSAAAPVEVGRDQAPHQAANAETRKLAEAQAVRIRPGLMTSGDRLMWVWPAAPEGSRLNLTINANVNVAKKVWHAPQWRNVYCPNGQIPVNVWSLRDGEGEWRSRGSASMDCEQLGYVQVSTAQYGLGPKDMIGVEFSIAIMGSEGVLPFASQIDNTSNDPTTLPAVLVRVKESAK